MRPTVLLFDIDGTLITTGGAGRRALERAFEIHFQRRDACDFPLDGMTDRRIFRLGLQAIGEQATQAAIDSLAALYLRLLDEEIASASPAQYRIHPGMEQAVEGGRRKPGYAVGLGTGNLKEGARLKLSRVDLYRQFSFGGFGCDHEDRAQLIRMGAERGAAQLGCPLADCRVVVVGDTPKDVAAAQAMGAESLGVATGSYSAKQLLEAGATSAFDTLESSGALDALLQQRP